MEKRTEIGRREFIGAAALAAGGVRTVWNAPKVGIGEPKELVKERIIRLGA